MSKQHPIRKMADRAEKCDTLLEVERSLARSVKPLLDALERDGHGVMFSERKDVVRCKHAGGCADCRLLAAWKEPL